MTTTKVRNFFTRFLLALKHTHTSGPLHSFGDRLNGRRSNWCARREFRLWLGQLKSRSALEQIQRWIQNTFSFPSARLYIFFLFFRLFERDSKNNHFISTFFPSPLVKMRSQLPPKRKRFENFSSRLRSESFRI